MRSPFLISAIENMSELYMQPLGRAMKGREGKCITVPSVPVVNKHSVRVWRNRHANAGMVDMLLKSFDHLLGGWSESASDCSKLYHDNLKEQA